MESNITEQQYSPGLLAEPHFDEEATILSARPVVPLGEIKAAQRSSKRLTFALALVAALVIGALGATLIYRQRVPATETATVETAAPDTNDGSDATAGPTAADAGGGRSDTTAPVSAPAASAAVSDALPSDPRDSAATRPRKPATVVAQSPVKSSKPWSDEVKNDEVSNLEEIRAQRRAERQEARRQRRQAAREAAGEVRSRRVQRSDDLLRIRDIFEGPRRPPRFQRWQ